MQSDLVLFTWLLALIWFLAYWILGGVFFSLVSLAWLGAVHKVRFSCLFTLLSAVAAWTAARGGMSFARDAVTACLRATDTKAEGISAILGCGFGGIFGSFFLGAVAVAAIGLLLMRLSVAKSKPWIVLEQPGEEGMTPEVAPTSGTIDTDARV